MSGLRATNAVKGSLIRRLTEDTLYPTIFVTALWLVVIGGCYAGDVIYKDERARSEWAMSLDFDGTPESDFTDATYFVAKGAGSRTFVAVAVSNDMKMCDRLFSDLDAEGPFTRELARRGFELITCGGTAPVAIPKFAAPSPDEKARPKCCAHAEDESAA